MKMLSTLLSRFKCAYIAFVTGPNSSDESNNKDTFQEVVKMSVIDANTGNEKYNIDYSLYVNHKKRIAYVLGKNGKISIDYEPYVKDRKIIIIES